MLHKVPSHELSGSLPRRESLNATRPSSSFNGDVESGIFTCDICGEFQTEPKLLSCLHSFCKACLPMCVQEDGRHIICPSCQEATRINPNLGLDGIPKNQLIEESLTYWLKQREIAEKQVRMEISLRK